MQCKNVSRSLSVVIESYEVAATVVPSVRINDREANLNTGLSSSILSSKNIFCCILRVSLLWNHSLDTLYSVLKNIDMWVLLNDSQFN